MTQTAATLDAKLINAITASTIEILNSMANTTATLKNIEASVDYKPTGDISAVIGIMGEQGEGMMALSFQVTLANVIVSRFLGLQPLDISSEDRADGIGELVNMISGKAKMALSENSKAPYRLSLPTVVMGANHEIGGRPKNNPYLNMFFDIEGMEFVIQVSFKFTD